MPDPYLYEGKDILKNLLNIKDKKLLEEAEAGYVTYRLKNSEEARRSTPRRASEKDWITFRV